MVWPAGLWRRCFSYFCGPPTRIEWWQPHARFVTSSSASSRFFLCRFGTFVRSSGFRREPLPLGRECFVWCNCKFRPLYVVICSGSSSPAPKSAALARPPRKPSLAFTSDDFTDGQPKTLHPQDSLVVFSAPSTKQLSILPPAKAASAFQRKRPSLEPWQPFPPAQLRINFSSVVQAHCELPRIDPPPARFYVCTSSTAQKHVPRRRPNSNRDGVAPDTKLSSASPSPRHDTPSPTGPARGHDSARPDVLLESEVPRGSTMLFP